jgi:spore coat polysaccharide biosynthesis protein SpsF (cytidylyltransferase family)
MQRLHLNSDFGVVLQARSGATRLPGKMTMPFYNNRGILEIVISAVLGAFDAENIFLATTTASGDDSLAEIGKQCGIHVFRGSESDVLQRFIDCSRENGLKHILRVCADNPFLRPNYLQQLATEYMESPSDYLSFAFPDGTPTIRSHIGLFGEMVALSALQKVSDMTTESFYHEHVTNFIYGNPQTFDVRFLPLPGIVRSRSDIRLTVDTSDDFEMAAKIFSELQSNENTTEGLIELIDHHPEMLLRMKKLINTYVK